MLLLIPRGQVSMYAECLDPVSTGKHNKWQLIVLVKLIADNSAKTVFLLRCMCDV